MTQPGIVLVFVDEKGNVIAHAADFERSRPAGFTVYEAQRSRAKRQLALNMVSAYASPMLARAVDMWDAEPSFAKPARVKFSKGSFKPVEVGNVR